MTCSIRALINDLKACSLKRDLQWGIRLHESAVDCRKASNIYVATALIKMYAKCSNMIEARRLFDRLEKPDVVSWTALLLGYVENGEGRLVLDLFSRMKSSGCEPDSRTYLAAVKACTSLTVRGENKEILKLGKEIHSEMGSYFDHHLQSALINMYSKCGCMAEARQTFESIEKPNVISWNALILGYAENGEGDTALQLFSSMKTHGCVPDSVTYISALKACASLAAYRKTECLERGREIHGTIGCPLCTNLQNTLTDMYSKCGSMIEAHRVFDGILKPTVVSWNVLLLGYVDNGQAQFTLDLFSKMQATGCIPNYLTYVACLKACSSLSDNGDFFTKRKLLRVGKEIHLEAAEHLNLYVQNTLIDMYVKCGTMAEARNVFDSINKPDVVSWNTLLLGYVETGDEQVALDLFIVMKARGCLPNSLTYIAAIKACTSLAVNGRGNGLERGKEIHRAIGGQMNQRVQCTLIDMYAKCGSMYEARLVFENIDKPTVASWNALILGYVDNGEGSFALDLYNTMKSGADHVTYIAALKACSSMAENEQGVDKMDCLVRGRQIHAEIKCHLDNNIKSDLMGMYAKCGSMVDARRVFDSIRCPDAVSCTTLLIGYAESGDGHAALDLFTWMKFHGCQPDGVTYVAALKACMWHEDGTEKTYFLERARGLHAEVGSHLDHYVTNTLIETYARCGSMPEAHSVFDDIREPDVYSWNAILLGYAENGDGHTALYLFSEMKASGCVPNTLTYVAGLKACTTSGALALGKKLHSEITVFSNRVVTCLVDFYAKCGSLVKAREVFDFHTKARDVKTYTALLTGYARFGDTTSVFELFEKMVDDGLRPNPVTLLCLLLCCSHSGFVEKAWKCFEVMHVKFGVAPTLMHYNCMIDVLGRAKELNKAVALVQKMPWRPDVVTWMTLLGACRKWKNVEIGRGAFQALATMGSTNASSYVLMAHIYGSKGMWEEQTKLLKTRS